MNPIDRNSPLPLYYQVAQHLRKQILGREIHLDEVIPSERELTNRYGVSRHTVRQAMDLLVSEGLVRRVQGVGSYVLPEGLEVRTRIDTFFEHRSLIEEFGFEPSVKHVKTETIQPDEEMRKALNLDEGDQVVCFTKIFLANGKPAILGRDHIPARNLQQPYDIEGSGENFFYFLEEITGARLEYLLSDILPVTASGEIAELFQCPPGTPLLLLKELFLDSSQNTPLQFGYNYHHPDFVRYSILRRRREP